jgi:hypothetical protein
VCSARWNDRDVPKNRLGCATFREPLVALLGERLSSETLDTAMLFGGRP